VSAHGVDNFHEAILYLGNSTAPARSSQPSAPGSAERFRASLVRVTVAASIFIPLALLLTWLTLSPLIDMLRSQYASAMAQGRSGEGFLEAPLLDFCPVKDWKAAAGIFAISFGLILTGAWIELTLET
jgi:hypothetical protein